MEQNNKQADSTARNYKMDNLKCMLIFAVVLGHMLELFMGGDRSDKLLYLVIYSFHMPLFAFVSGVFARYKPEKIRNNMIYPYLIFQTLYLVFARVVLEKDAGMQYTTPYWLLWYLFAIIVWNLVLPLVQSASMSLKKKVLLLLAALTASVLIGFDTKAGYYLSVSRIVEFFPYFLLGVYYRELREKLWKNRNEEKPNRMRKAVVFLLLCAAAVCVVLVLAANVENIRSAWLYGSVSYERGHYSWLFRVFGIAAALVWIGFFMVCMPGRRIPVISAAGANTMPVYLLHGFVVKLLSKCRFFGLVENDELFGILISLLLVFLLSRKTLTEALAPLFRWNRNDYRLLAEKLSGRGISGKMSGKHGRRMGGGRI